jgi:DNA processing protein
MKTIYPPIHTEVAREMISHGGLLTDFVSNAPAERNNFLKRNRIIAGLPTGLLVVESGVKGGAMVTAEMAFSYNHDVMAVPGRPSDNWSSGCNRLIKRNIAALVENANDICQLLNWERPGDRVPEQTQIFHDLDETENMILNLIEKEDLLTADQISVITGIPVNRLATSLLSLEMKGAARSYPGNVYGKR